MAENDGLAIVADNPDRLRYEIHVDGALAGFLTYRAQPGGLVLVHTEVADEFEGHGLASQLVREALDDIRRRGLHVVPRCPLVAKYIRRHPEYEDLVTEPAL
jgi:predicted GNAT family acetyltransferase